jgi:hypothetical protein
MPEQHRPPCVVSDRQIGSRLALIWPEYWAEVCPKGVTALKKDLQQARDLAEASFKKKEAQLREGQKAMAEYNMDRRALRDKTARLRALRLARDADEMAGPAGSADKR